MSTPASYRTIARDATADIVEKRSTFRCTLARTADMETARAVVAQCRSRWPDARHHCSAMVIGPDSAVRHSSDDGEPSGTAGTPMTEALLAAGISDVVAVVTRWFGGTLLGTGGLARAYRDAVRAALDRAGVCVRTALTEVAVTLPHAEAGRIESAVRAAGFTVMGADYDAAVTMHIGAADPEELLRHVARLTAGAAHPQIIGTRWFDASVTE